MNPKIFNYLNVLYLQGETLTASQVKVLAYWELVGFSQERESDLVYDALSQVKGNKEQE